MGNVTFKLNREGVRKLLKSQEMKNGLSKIAFSAKGRLGDGYSASYYIGKKRVVARVTAVSPKAIQENSETNSILKALKESK